jgi:hypothetical protein
MIDTLSNIKTLLQISDTSKDILINMLMPLVENNIHDITKNDFIKANEQKYISAITISFDKDNSKILDSDNNLDTFESGQTIKVFGSYHNDAIYYVNEVAEDGSYLVINSESELIDEDAGQTIRIYKVTYPKALKLINANMINHRLSKNNGNVVSESIDDYSVSYAQDGQQGYPRSIILDLNTYKKFYRSEDY